MVFLTCLSKGPWHIEEKEKKREMIWKKDEPSSKHICVRWCPMCCSNLWEHLCLWHEGTFITFLLSLWHENPGGRISMRHLGHTSRRTPHQQRGEAGSTHPLRILKSVGIRMHQRRLIEYSNMSTKTELRAGKSVVKKLWNEGLAQRSKKRLRGNADV